MPITVISKGAVESQDAKKEVFKPSELKELKRQYKWREEVLSGKEVPAMMGGGKYRPLDRIQDPQEMRKQMRQYKKDYERGLPPVLSPATRNSLWKRAKQLKDEFTVGMLSQRDLHPVKHRQIAKNGGLVTTVVADNDVMESRKAVQRQRAWQKKNDNKVREFKHIMRILEPNNPHIGSIERFRPKGG